MSPEKSTVVHPFSILRLRRRAAVGSRGVLGSGGGPQDAGLRGADPVVPRRRRVRRHQLWLWGQWECEEQEHSWWFGIGPRSKRTCHGDCGNAVRRERVPASLLKGSSSMGGTCPCFHTPRQLVQCGPVLGAPKPRPPSPHFIWASLGHVGNMLFCLFPRHTLATVAAEGSPRLCCLSSHRLPQL